MNLTAKFICDWSFARGHSLLREKGLKIDLRDNESYQTIIQKAQTNGSVILTTDIFFSFMNAANNVILVVE